MSCKAAFGGDKPMTIIEWFKDFFDDFHYFLFVTGGWVIIVLLLFVITGFVSLVYLLKYEDEHQKRCNEACQQYRMYKCDTELAICGSDKKDVLRQVSLSERSPEAMPLK